MVNTLDSDTIIRSIADTFSITYSEALQMVSQRVREGAFFLTWPVTSQSIPISVTVSQTAGTYTSEQTPITKSLRVNAGAAGLNDVYTPTSGKTLYITQLTVCSTAAIYAKVGDNVSNALADATSYDGHMFSFDADATMGFTLTFNAPMVVSTKLNTYVSAAGVLTVSFTGWEQ